MRLAKVAKQLNVSIDRLAEKLASRGEEVEARPNTKLTGEQYDILLSEFQSDKIQKAESKKVSTLIKEDKEAMRRIGSDETVAEPSKEEAPAKTDPTAQSEKPSTPKVETPAAVETKQEDTPPEAPPKESSIAEPSKTDAPAPAAKTDQAEKAKEDADLPTSEDKPVAKEETKIAGLKTKGTIDLDALERSQRPKSKSKPAAKKTEDKPKKTSPPPKTTVILNKKSAADQDVVKASGARLKGITPKGSLDDIKNELSNKKQLELEEERLREQLRSNVENLKKKEAEEKTAEKSKAESKEAETDENVIVAKAATLSGPTLTGQKIDLSQFAKKKKVASSSGRKDDASKRKRKRISTDNKGKGRGPSKGKNQPQAAPPTEQEMKKAISDTLGKLTNKVKSKGSKYRRSKRDERREKLAQVEKEENANKVIQATEFVTVNEMASMMDVSVTEVISTCMMLGLMVTMNQRLDAETLQIVAEEFGYGIEFTSSDIEDEIGSDIVDNEEDYVERAPVVTIMGHVDHGKTSLLDYIRDTNVISGEAGGITQHIGSYHVEMENGKKITFIDTPGHEAFTAMRARGAQVTDLVVIVISAEDRVMPQTKEAISHAQAANVPMIIAYNKIDKPNANPDRIREELSQMNVLVEEWGGKLQSQEVSAKTGQGVQTLLEKIAIEAELMELKANPKTNAKGAVLEASLDKGKGYVTNILVQNGTLSVGDFLLSGQYYGKVKAMHDERGQRIAKAGPSRPVSILGLNGAPQAGDKFIVLNDEKEAKSIATKRTQLQREQNVRTQKQMTLDEIGRRLSIGDFQELNLIIKGDVDGSIEALSDSLQKLSTESIQVNIVHKAVGQVTDSDVLLAAASQAIIIGFQVRPSASARKIAEKEDVEVRTYSIIYDAIDDIKVAMEGMLAPTIKEEIIGNLLIRETFRISKVGTIAGCYVTSGKVLRNSLIRIIRDGIVVHTGKLGSLKRFKDDVSEVGKGFECGLNIDNYNDIKVDDVIEVYQEVEQKTTL